MDGSETFQLTGDILPASWATQSGLRLGCPSTYSLPPYLLYLSPHLNCHTEVADEGSHRAAWVHELPMSIDLCT